MDRQEPWGVIGHFFHDDGMYRATLDGAKMQIYANKVNGEGKMQKARESRNYDYQYTEVYALDEEGQIQPYNKIMEMSHWEYDSSKGRKILYTSMLLTTVIWMKQSSKLVVKN